MLGLFRNLCVCINITACMWRSEDNFGEFLPLPCLRQGLYLLICLYLFIHSAASLLEFTLQQKRVGTASLSVLDLLLLACNPVPQTEAVITRTTMFLITPHKVKSLSFVGRCWKKKAPPLGYCAWNLSTATGSWGRMSNIDGSCLLWEEDSSSLEQNFHLSEQWDLKMGRVVLQAPCSPLLLFLGSSRFSWMNVFVLYGHLQ